VSRSRQIRPILDHDTLGSAFAEGYRALGATITSGTAQPRITTIMVASAAAGEGRTTTVLNLGIVLAEAGLRVTVVELDFRRPAFCSILCMTHWWPKSGGPASGLMSFITGAAPLHDVLVRAPFGRLVVVPAGPVPPNPGGLLGSRPVRAAIKHLSEGSDYVLIDSPPWLAYADALQISRIVDGVLYVVRAGSQRSVQTVAQIQLRRANARLVGVVWNDAERKGAGWDGGRGRFETTAESRRRDREEGSPGQGVVGSVGSTEHVSHRRELPRPGPNGHAQLSPGWLPAHQSGRLR